MTRLRRSFTAEFKLEAASLVLDQGYSVPAIRKVIYTTNAIESLNSVLRKATKQRKRFPTDDSALKVAFLAIQQASKKWTMPIQNWKLALNRFIIEFGDRLNGHL